MPRVSLGLSSRGTSSLQSATSRISPQCDASPPAGTRQGSRWTRWSSTLGCSTRGITTPAAPSTGSKSPWEPTTWDTSCSPTCCFRTLRRRGRRGPRTGPPASWSLRARCTTQRRPVVRWASVPLSGIFPAWTLRVPAFRCWTEASTTRTRRTRTASCATCSSRGSWSAGCRPRGRPCRSTPSARGSSPAPASSATRTRCSSSCSTSPRTRSSTSRRR
mmetsp:Transcript_2819/g.4491  ORF Transcript_2819/g.4491 Transcript_2819/m.4491 type:complete len:218 (-) Transcript_2819:625-1278(-)